MYLKIQGIVETTVVENFRMKGLISSLLARSTAFFCDYSEFEIPIGQDFDFLIDVFQKKEYEVKCKVIFVTQAWGLPYDLIPIGSKTICFFDIDERSKIILLKTLPIVKTWFYNPHGLILSDTKDFIR